MAHTQPATWTAGQSDNYGCWVELRLLRSTFDKPIDPTSGGRAAMCEGSRAEIVVRGLTLTIGGILLANVLTRRGWSAPGRMPLWALDS